MLGARFTLKIVGTLSATCLHIMAQGPALLPRTSFTFSDRAAWVSNGTVGAKNLSAGVFVAGIQTWRHSPEHYGPHWDGFGKRYGARLASGATNNAIEAGLGGLWGEDPRYFPAKGKPLKSRLGHVVKMAFITHNRAGETMPAYARYVAFAGGNLVSNTWRPDSPSTAGNVSLQVGFNFMNRIIGNAFSEFMPGIDKRRRNSPQTKEDHIPRD